MEKATDIPEFRRQSFIVRLWQEESGPQDAAQWRGNIVHVPSGDHKYFNDLDEITLFIAKYLERLDARVDFQRHFRRWLRWRGKGKPTRK